MQKRNYFQKLNTYNQIINNALNEIFPNWQMEFTNLLVDLGENILNGSDFISSLNNLPNNNLRCLYIAKIYGLLGMTSCGWFFGTKSHTIEQNIPQQSIEIIEAILPILINRSG